MKREATNNVNEPLTLHTSPLTNGAGQRAPLFGWMAHGHVAFTMAEILLSLTIIGVVAAITLPSLTGNINERTWNTQRKALYSRMSQAIALMPALNGYGIGATDEETIENAAETFVTNGLSKVLKINNICDSTHLSDCGLPNKLFDMKNGVIETFPTKLSELQPVFVGKYVNSAGGYSFVEGAYAGVKIVNAAAFETANGESLAVYYNPNCVSDMNDTGSYYVQPKLCVNFIYDLNGKKGPNTLNKDIGFISVLYPTDSVVVAPMVSSVRGAIEATQVEASSYCRGIDDEARLPNKHEAMSLFYNQKLIGSRWHTMTSSLFDKDRYWYLNANVGRMELVAKDSGAQHWAHCVKR